MANPTSDLALALRAIQKADDLPPGSPEARDYLMRACDLLGFQLGLECSSDDPRDHNGDTCPIHEWLVPGDHEDLHLEEIGA